MVDTTHQRERYFDIIFAYLRTFFILPLASSQNLCRIL